VHNAPVELPPARSLCKWMCVCAWVRENSPSHLCLWVRERTHLPFAVLSNHTSDNLLTNRILDGWTDPNTPKRIPITLSDTLTLRDTEWYPNIEWYPLRTHPRGYPLHWVIPIPWVSFPLTDSSHNPPKSLPITLRDPVFLTNKPDTKWYPLHSRIPLTLSDTYYPEFF
jgi:hypothetical protein